tara:strand:+ start:1406 stop:2260 length:855 start_codon:yes stop_codon:yes gene_type:complete
MNKIKLTIISIIFLYTNFTASIAAEVKGAADIYKVTMKKIELCTGHTTGDFDDTATSTTQCQNAVTIGESAGGVEVDIASVEAGAVAGAFGNPMVLPLGETYTHLRVTLDRKMTIRTAAGIDTTGSGPSSCKTISSTNSMYGTTEAARKYTHRPTVADNAAAAAIAGTSEEMNIYMLDGKQQGEAGDTMTQCTNVSCGTSSAANWNYAATAAEMNSAVAMQTMRQTTVTDDIALIYPLSEAFTVGLVTPTIDMAFGTSSAINAEDIGALCSFGIGEPTVTITIK